MESKESGGNPRITLCGTPQVTDDVDGMSVSSPLTGRRVQVLAARLVLDRERGGLTRGQLATTVWGDNWPDTWASALRGLITKVRRSLNRLHNKASLTFDGEMYRLVLDRSVTVDVEEALQLLKSAQRQADALSDDPSRLNSLLSFADSASPMAHALEVLGKPFLPEVDGEWVDLVRHRLQTAHLELTQMAAKYALEAGHNSEAVEFSSMAVAADPLSDLSMCLRLRALIAAGNRARAVDEYILFRNHLDDELGIAPEEETQHIYLSALGCRERTPKNSRGKSQAPVIQYGVTDQFNEARRRWQDTLRGRGGHLRVRGEPGSGKSAFVQALLREFGAQAEHVIVCDAWEAPAGRSVLAHALASHRRRLPGQHSEPDPVDRNESVADMVRHLQSVGVEEPVLLLIDDLDRSDETTRRTLTALMSSRRWPPRLMVVSTTGIEDGFDADSPHCLLPHAVPWNRVVTLRLLRLDEIQKLLTDLGQADLPPKQVTRIHELSGGNPLLASLISTLDEGDVGPAVRALLRYQTRTLGPDDLAVLEATALCGPVVELSVLTAVLPIETTAVLSSLARLKRLHLLADVPLPEPFPDTQAVRFIHGVYSEATLASVSPVTAASIARKLTVTVFHDGVGTSRLYVRRILREISARHLRSCPEKCPQAILECLKEAIAVGDKIELEELLRSIVGLLPDFDQETALGLRLELAQMLVPLDTAAARDLMLDTAGVAIRTNDLPLAMGRCHSV